MRRTILIFSFCLLAALLFAIQFSAAPLTLRVNEKATTLDFSETETAALLSLDNVSGRGLSARIRLELIDTDDRVRGAGELNKELQAGPQRTRVPLDFDFKKLDVSDKKEFPLYRLRYSVSTIDSMNAQSGTAEGIISLSEITPDLFELRLTAARRAREGSRYRVRVQALHPITRQPVGNVQLAGEIELDGGEKEVLQAGGVTDMKGHAWLDFNLPARVADEEADVMVKGRLKIFEQEATASLEFDRTARMLLTTDKPLYQPGQVLHLRTLVFDASERAMPETTATFIVEDPDGATVFRASSRTTRFGVATADWQIPDNAPLGDYQIKVELDEGRYEDSMAIQSVKISRYDLPNFTVSTKADHAYYLPDRNAKVEVRADYLFGQAVKRGRVRVVREKERRWNFKEQKWETEEGETIEGELDGSGRFVARIDLKEEHANLQEESYSRFRDLSYAAYITDATTNRTEQRRFDLRLTKEPIHIYVAEGNYKQAEGMPLAFYVSASYADGTPAECEVSVEVTEEDADGSRYYYSTPRPETGQKHVPLTIVRTNRYGVAKVTGPPASGDSGSNHYLSFKLSARDRKGLTGHHYEGMWVNSESVVRVETDKPVYRAGDPLRAFITSNKEDAILFVDVASESKVVRSEAVRLERGRASVTFPYGKDFDGRLSVVASFYEQPENRYSSGEVLGRRTILYPRDRELKLEVELGQAVYRPGEDAQATLSAKDADGRQLESVFGVVVFDKAVEERARTDQEFNHSYGFYSYFRYFLYGGGEVGGVTLRDLERMEVKRKVVPEDLRLAAEILLQHTGQYYERMDFESDGFVKNQADVFGALTRVRLKNVKEALDVRYYKTTEYPSDEQSLRRILREAGIEFDQLRDPWNMPYRAYFSSEGADDVTYIMSAGADKEFGTRDDFNVYRFARPYFRTLGERIDRAINDYHTRTGLFIRDEATLKTALSLAGINSGALLDRWNNPYRLEFGTMGVLLAVRIRSAGPDKRFDKEGHYGSDDFIIWTTWVDSFGKERAAIDKALDSYLRATGRFPQDETSFREALKRAGIDPDRLRDPFGRIYQAGFKSESSYVNRVRVEARYSAGGMPEKRTTVVPVSQRVYIITLFSAGADLKGGTSDDFNAATFTSIANEQAASDEQAVEAKPATTFAGATGALTGIITDPTGAVIPGASVIAVSANSAVEYRATTDNSGLYILRNLPPGHYTVTVSSSGFTTYRIEGVPVRSSTLIKVDATLNAASVSETVNVTSSAGPTLNTTDSTVGTNVRAAVPKEKGSAQLATPRLREYFPETLVWQPALETDRDGRALLRFKLADNITTWKMSVIGSTASGEIGTAEREFKAFQPFFVEHDPPRILTEGDEIALPVVLRNYLDRQQSVALEMKPEGWFSLAGAPEKRAEVRAGDATREVFRFRATSSVRDGKQRITAIGGEASDAIERVVTVHPDGQERAETDSRVFIDRATLETEIPTEAIKGTLRGELKIYPNLIGHVIESIEGIMQRPYGGGEQTISSTYPSLLVLKAYKQSGAAPPEKLGARAMRYLRSGYERLLNYRSQDGGFSYWGGDAQADLALTAYALRFLTDAREFIEVNEEVVAEARQWLIKEQLEDGSWQPYFNDDRAKGSGSALTTALIARTLARIEKGSPKASSSSSSSSSSSAQKEKTARDALLLALTFLDKPVAEMDEPYLIASYALSALEAGDNQRAERAIARLNRMARDEGDGSYWTLETNTPFYGWGMAGRIETTALVLQALARGNEKGEAEGSDALVNRGLLFLLKRKDRYGVWYSTQATVNVVEALIALLSTPSTDRAASNASVIVNGRQAITIQLPPPGQLTAPLTYDLSQFLSTGSNRVEITRTGGGSAARVSAQVVSNYYLPWTKALADDDRQSKAGAVRLSVNFDKTESGVTDEVTCKVKAERVGSRGYGMMLAEIGLPPGADVDRATLNLAMEESGWSFTRYDLLPDRLVVYLWPSAGGTSFDFKFRPRYGINALTAPSVLYDYYNPEAHTTLAPVRFVVR